MVVYPVNNDKVIPITGEIRKSMAMSVKDAHGHIILNVMRHYFGSGSRERAIAFTRRLVELINNEERVEVTAEATETKTLAEIVAELRDAAMNGEYDDSTVNDWADRIEAAAKRERAELEEYAKSKMLDGATIIDNRTGGNAAAMHELIRRIVKSLGGKAEVAPTTMTPHEVAILNQCRAALSAPPRNCDVYSHDEALRVWATEKENEQKGCFDEWLYHVATRQKGEADGK